MQRALEQLVWRRAQSCCEYCGLRAADAGLPLQIDHIIAQKHGGLTVADNPALSCFYCNSYKGPNISGVDPATGAIATLFNPRKDRWADHFVWNGSVLAGLTPAGRATIEVLVINHPDTIERREILIRGGLQSPNDQ